MFITYGFHLKNDYSWYFLERLLSLGGALDWTLSFKRVSVWITNENMKPGNRLIRKDYFLRSTSIIYLGKRPFYRNFNFLTFDFFSKKCFICYPIIESFSSWLVIISMNSSKSIVPSPSISASFIIASSSSSVGFWPSDLITIPNSSTSIVPFPSLSNNLNASLNLRI